MRLNERLNIVLPCYHDEEEPYAWVHSAPIGREVFDSSYMLIAKTFTGIHTEGLGEVGGPRVALNVMRDVARQIVGRDGDPDRIMMPLLNEIRRLSNVIVRTDDKWETHPLEDAIKKKLLDEDDVYEVENSLAFFTCVWRMFPTNQRQEYMDGATRLWGAQMSSFSCTDFRNSLPTSTTTVSTGARTPASSVPS